ncbi:suppressor of fused domain protein [Puteibacter caeruleilacunae]|nr:suppressor of fused domain protein [Puteibacter caeruleilacunae]
MDWIKNKSLISRHYESIWGSNCSFKYWDLGPMQELSKEFCVQIFEPYGKRNYWIYATNGMSNKDDEKLEIHLFCKEPDDSHVELLTIVAYYHLNVANVGLNHTVNFGRPWLPGSKCTYGLISLPYLDGPNLEYEKIDGDPVRFLWLVPITEAEKNYKVDHGIGALEGKFESKKFNYLDSMRESVV